MEDGPGGLGTPLLLVGLHQGLDPLPRQLVHLEVLDLADEHREPELLLIFATLKTAERLMQLRLRVLYGGIMRADDRAAVLIRVPPCHSLVTQPVELVLVLLHAALLGLCIVCHLLVRLRELKQRVLQLLVQAVDHRRTLRTPAVR